MFLLFGFLAFVTAVCNLVFCLKGKNTDFLRFLSISFTALTVCTFYWMVSQYVAKEDWSALMDVVPTVSRLCWLGTGASIAINGITFFLNKKR